MKEQTIEQTYTPGPWVLRSHGANSPEAIANEIDCHQHSARAHSLRVVARKQRAAIAKATGKQLATTAD